jgi:anti-sigma-K factor RskA
MKLSDEVLMAYADGELDEPARSEVEHAMRTDPAVAARVARHKALRANVFEAFAGVLDEKTPPRLDPAAIRGKVVHLDAVRAARHQVHQEPQERSRWAWPQWGAIAATLVVGVLAGMLGYRGMQGGGPLVPIAGQEGALVAQGSLAQALSQQLASASTRDSQVRIGVSFATRDGSYCRSFAFGSTAGLACRSGEHWKIPVLAESEPGAAGAYRQAGSEMPQAVLDAIDQRIDGAGLDAAGEKAAQRRGWKR